MNRLSLTAADRWTIGGKELDSVTLLFYTGFRWYDGDLGRFYSEDPDGAASANGYRYPRNSPRNVKIVGPSARDGLEAATWFFAGMSDTLTAGLTKRIRKGMGTDGTVAEDSGLYRWGGYAGQVVNAGLSLGTGGLSGLAKLGSQALNATSSVGNALNAAEEASKGNYRNAALFAASAGLSAVRGRSPCSWASSIAGWGQRGLHAIGAANNLSQAYDKAKSGDWIGAILDTVQAGIDARRFMQACFAAGTKLLTKRGWVCIEDIVVGDEVWSRPELEPGHPGGWKLVEELFVRTGRVWKLRVGGEEILTTGEHPFYTRKAGEFVEARTLQVGDELLGRNGEWTTIEGVEDSEEYARVYNLRVAEWHTYFVGGETWGFDVWAHNACQVQYDGQTQLARRAADYRAQMIRAGQRIGDGRNVAVIAYVTALCASALRILRP